jgi:3-methyladenine DNA glycosylase AlkD
MNVVLQIQQALRDQGDPVRAAFTKHFFKVEPGDKDEFLGVTVPKQRAVAKQYFRKISPPAVLELLHSIVHDDRLTALFIWLLQYQTGDAAVKKQIYGLYLKNAKWVNNWDLVDSSARDIVGAYLFDKDRADLDKLSRSRNVWERRIAIIATYYFLKRGELAWTLKLAERYLPDAHHYIHKATGWMLREVGKQDRQVLLDFLDQHAPQMPRTALRYAIEHLDPVTRADYLARR